MLTLGFDHLVIEIVALAGALADAGEHRIAAMRLGDVVDQFHDQHGLADAGATEQADLAALGIRGQEIDDLDTRLEDLSVGRLVDIIGRRLVDGAHVIGLDRARLVDRLPDDVHDATERGLADRHPDRGARIGHRLTTRQALGNIHRDAADGILAEVLRDFQHQPVAVVAGLERVQDLGQMPFELHVHHRTDDLRDLAGRAVRAGLVQAVVAGVVGHIVHDRLSALVRARRPSSEELEGFGARDDLDQFLRDHRLTGAVVDLRLPS